MKNKRFSLQIGILVFSSMGFGQLAIAGQAKQKRCLKLLSTNVAAPAISSKENTTIARWVAELAPNPLQIGETLIKTKDFSRFVTDQNVNWTDLRSAAQRDLAFKYIESRWQHLSEANEGDRAALMYLDLVKLGLKPIDGQTLEPFAARHLLTKLSQRNLAKLLATLSEKTPDVSISRFDESRIERMVEQIAIGFAKTYRQLSKASGPILPERELQKMGLLEAPSFWSEFVNGATSVGLEAAGAQVNTSGAPRKFVGSINETELYVDPTWVETEGFAVPGLRNVRDLFWLFYSWKPAAFQNFLNSNRNYLSASELAPRTFLNMTDEDLEARFPASDPSGRLVQLRKQLIDFVLTPVDLITFMRAALKAYLTAQFSKSMDRGLDGLSKASRNPYSLVQAAMTCSDFPAGWIVRIPGAIPRNRWRVVGN